MAVIITVINNKGGTGKTTTVHNLGAALTRKKKRVLLVDLDSQCNLTSALGLSTKEPNLSTLLLGKCAIKDVIHYDGLLAGIPSCEKVLETEAIMNHEPGREYILKEQLEKVKDDFDYVIIDCPPSLGILAVNSLVAANFFIVPMQAENFAFIGLDRIMLITEKVRKRMNPDLHLAGILFVKLVPRTKFSQAVITQLTENEHLRNKLFDTFIRQDISLMESGAFNKSVFDFAPGSRGADDYKDFANEFLQKYGKK